MNGRNVATCMYIFGSSRAIQQASNSRNRLHHNFAYIHVVIWLIIICVCNELIFIDYFPFLPSLPPSLTHSFPHSLTPSLSPSLPPSFPHSLPPSVFPSLPPSLTHFLPPSLPPSLPHSLPHSLTPSLSPSLPHSLLPSLTPSFLPSLHHPLPPSLTPPYREKEVEHFGTFLEQMKEAVLKVRGKFIDHCHQMSGRE